MPVLKTRRLGAALARALTIAGAIGMLSVASARQRAANPQLVTTGALRGQSSTELPDGRLLLVGGEASSRMLGGGALIDPRTGVATPLAGSLAVPRTEHTATVMADGSILIIGGRNSNGVVDIAERFDPATLTFSTVSVIGSVPRALHSATLLTDGRVLVVGGSTGGPAPAPTELWDLRTQTATALPAANVIREGHTTTILADGRVQVTGGRDVDGNTSDAPLIVDPTSMTVIHETRVSHSRSVAPSRFIHPTPSASRGSARRDAGGAEGARGCLGSQGAHGDAESGSHGYLWPPVPASGRA